MISSLELARLAGISQGTVDRALHNRPGISEATRKKVLALAKTHGYRPHPAVRELITKTSHTVGVILPVINNIFFMDIFQELEKHCAERNLRLELTPVTGKDAFLQTLENFASKRHRLAIVIPPEDNLTIPKSITESLPIISLISPCKGKGLHFISPDEEETGRIAVRYLHQQGHRNILHLTYSRKSEAILARARGYESECRKLRLKYKTLIHSASDELEKLLHQEKATALFCHNDWLALTVILALTKKGIRVPEDISVLGVDDSPTLASLYPDLTTLHYPREALGQSILDILDQKSTKSQSLSCKVIERGTVSARLA